MKFQYCMAMMGSCLIVAATAFAVPIRQVDSPPKKDPQKEFTNSIGMRFVWIPPGTFLMGSPKVEKERCPWEILHKVTLTKGFYMGAYTVTQEQWSEVMGNNPSEFKGKNNLPVECVSWNDAQEFVTKLGKKDMKIYRLPTEAEWEYACRAGTTTRFNVGETLSTEQANYGNNQTMPVGSFTANRWGLHDTHGNVSQWCQDWYGEYPENDVVDPQGPNAGNDRVVRGACWGDWGSDTCRSAFRINTEPNKRGTGIGFRICFFPK